MKHCIWLSGDAIDGDDTDGHIDQLARFTDDETIVYAWSDDPQDPQRTGLQRNLDDLKRGLSAAGMDHVRLIPLSVPGPVELFGQRIPASYCNFLITNQRVIVPQFGKAEDRGRCKHFSHVSKPRRDRASFGQPVCRAGVISLSVPATAKDNNVLSPLEKPALVSRARPNGEARKLCAARKRCPTERLSLQQQTRPW